MKGTLKIFTLSFCLLMALPVSAATEFKNADMVNVPTSEIINGDLYSAGGMVSIAGSIKGDVLVAGGKIDITGSVQQDVMAAGGFVDITANVADDIRVTGGFITIDGPVKGDVISTGGFITLGPNAKVDGDLVVVGGLIMINGQIAGRALIEGGKVVINGQLNGPTQIKVDESLEFGASAVVSKGVEYYAPKEAMVHKSASIQAIKYNQKIAPVKWEKKKNEWAGREKEAGQILAGIVLAIWFAKLLTILVAALIFAWLFKKASKAVVEATIKDGNTFGKALLTGFIFLIVTPIATLVLLLTFFLSYFSAVLALLLAVIICLAKITTGIVMGSLIFRWFDEKKQLKVTGWSVTVGTVIAALIALIPFLGWLVILVFWLATMGGIAQLAYKNYWLKR